MGRVRLLRKSLKPIADGRTKGGIFGIENSTGAARAEAFIANMKTLIAILVASGFALAAQAGDSDSGTRTLVIRKIKPTTVTGTNIARPVNRIGNTYDTTHAIYVIDRTRIEQSGASSVAQLLRRQPGIGIH